MGAIRWEPPPPIISPAEARRLHTIPIAEAEDRRWARIAGVVRSVTVHPPRTAPGFELDLDDGSGTLRVQWVGQSDIPGASPGRRLLVEGRVARDERGAALRDPRYELLPGRPA
jgi:hypothetical protein